MSRLRAAFEQDHAALVIYLCAGDPSIELTPALIVAAASAGADVVEVGMPFSDPTADGPTIQAASERALAGGATLKSVLDAVALAREQTEVPIVLFGYYNPILRYGEARLAADAARAGVDALLVVDLPPEHAAPLIEPLGQHGLDFVPLLAPTSTPERVRAAAAVAGSFIYYVSMTGVTGTAGAPLARAAERAAQLSADTGKKVVVGFGVRSAEDVRTVAARADGVVVGSAVVKAVHEASEPVAALRRVVSELASGCVARS